MRVTIKDVARLARVSVKTVSRVLNESPQVSDETREAVLKAIRELNFRPNALARSLVLGTSMTIGLIIADITNPFFPEVVRGVEDAAREEDYNVILCNSDEDPAKELSALNLLLEKQVDGVILIGSRVAENELVALADEGVHIVTVNRDTSHPSIGCVTVTNAESARQAVDLLVKAGRSRIAHIMGSALSSSSQERFEGYKSGLISHGIPYDPALVACAPPTRAGGFEAMSRILSGNRHPDGLFAYNDLQAIGAIDAIKAAGLAVPRDIAVIGYDDIELAAFASPPLTTFNMPKYEMGQKAMKLLLKMMEGKGGHGMKVTISPSIIIRESCPAGLAADIGARSEKDGKDV